jgi:hypothetical protein
MQVGGYLRVPLSKSEAKQASEYHLDIGDEIISTYLDTDDYEYHSLFMRGVGVARSTRTSHTQAISGWLLKENMFPYMQTGHAIQKPMTVFSMQRQLSKTLQIHSLDGYDDKITFIQSFGWRPTGAIGYTRKMVDAYFSYTLAGPNFQRPQTPYYSDEAIGPNARISLSPIEAVNLYYSHDDNRTTIVGYPTVTAVSDSANMSVTLA